MLPASRCAPPRAIRSLSGLVLFGLAIGCGDSVQGVISSATSVASDVEPLSIAVPYSAVVTITTTDEDRAVSDARVSVVSDGRHVRATIANLREAGSVGAGQSLRLEWDGSALIEAKDGAGRRLFGSQDDVRAIARPARAPTRASDSIETIRREVVRRLAGRSGARVAGPTIVRFRSRQSFDSVYQRARKSARSETSKGDSLFMTVPARIGTMTLAFDRRSHALLSSRLSRADGGSVLAQWVHAEISPDLFVLVETRLTESRSDGPVKSMLMKVTRLEVQGEHKW